jgi:UDP:flavonoid glycosyltransferase YjiC (YdhE family)
LAPGTVTVEGVRGAVEQLLADESFRAVAERIAIEMQAMPGPAEVADVMAGRFA